MNIELIILNMKGLGNKFYLILVILNWCMIWVVFILIDIKRFYFVWCERKVLESFEDICYFYKRDEEWFYNLVGGINLFWRGYWWRYLLGFYGFSNMEWES